MKIPALRIEINGVFVAEAGAEDLSLLTGQVGIGVGSTGALDLSSIMFSVMGLAVSGPNPRQLTWGHGTKLKPGDRVSFQFIETEHPNPPSKILSTPSSEELAATASAESHQTKRRAKTPNPAFKRTPNGAA